MISVETSEVGVYFDTEDSLLEDSNLGGGGEVPDLTQNPSEGSLSLVVSFATPPPRVDSSNSKRVKINL